MTTELYALTALTLLASSLWIPYIVGVNTSPSGSTDFSRPQDPSVHPAWVHRAFRAHPNLLEQGMPFAVMILIAHLAGVSTPVTVWASVLFLALRLVHAVGMISGLAVFPFRSVVFSLGWMCILAIGAVVLTA